jgi:hypothetical protein
LRAFFLSFLYFFLNPNINFKMFNIYRTERCIDPDFLEDDELNYELRIRQESGAQRKNVATRRLILRANVAAERKDPNLFPILTHFSLNEELQICSNKLAALTRLCDDPTGHRGRQFEKRLSSRLNHIEQRLKRVLYQYSTDQRAKQLIDVITSIRTAFIGQTGPVAVVQSEPTETAHQSIAMIQMVTSNNETTQASSGRGAEINFSGVPLEFEMEFERMRQRIRELELEKISQNPTGAVPKQSVPPPTANLSVPQSFGTSIPSNPNQPPNNVPGANISIAQPNSKAQADANEKQRVEQQRALEQRRAFEQRQALEQQRAFEQRQAFEQRRAFEQQQAYEKQQAFEHQRAFEQRRVFEQQFLQQQQQRQFLEQQAYEDFQRQYAYGQARPPFQYQQYGQGSQPQCEYRVSSDLDHPTVQISSIVGDQEDQRYRNGQGRQSIPDPPVNSFVNRPLPESDRSGHKSLPVSKWGLTFSGEGKTANLQDFLTRVKVLAKAENCNDEELRRSAYHLLSGTAREWYVAFGEDFDSWNELVAELKLYFLAPNNDTQVRRYIDSRRQKRFEPFLTYLADMEQNFKKLSYQVPEAEKTQTIKDNLNSFFAEKLVLLDIRTMEVLKKCCRRIEALNVIQRPEAVANARRFEPQRRVAELEFEGEEELQPKETPKFETEEVCAIRGQPSKLATKPQTKTLGCQTDSGTTTSTPTNPGMKCYNCQNYGHHHNSCSEPRTRLFCFGCGAPDTAKPSCPNCSGNHQRGAEGGAASRQ